MVELCFLVWDCCGQSCGGRSLGAPFPAWLGRCTEAHTLDLAGSGVPYGGRQARSQGLFGWVCWESRSLAHNISVSCQARLSVLSMETWRAVRWQVQGTWPELHCWCLGITRQDFLQTRNAKSSRPGQVIVASHPKVKGIKSWAEVTFWFTDASPFQYGTWQLEQLSLSRGAQPACKPQRGQGRPSLG